MVIYCTLPGFSLDFFIGCEILQCYEILEIFCYKFNDPKNETIFKNICKISIDGSNRVAKDG